MSKWFNKKYRVTPKTSKLLQEAVLGDAGKGFSNNGKVEYLQKPYLFIDDHGWITHMGEGEECYFRNHNYPEGLLSVIDVPTLMVQEPSVKEKITLGDKTYYKEDLEKALENIKPIEEK